MGSINLSEEDLRFLKERAQLAEITPEEYLTQVIDQHRLRLKYPPKSSEPIVLAKPNIEPPHRKWGM
jgi:hypothetical protein